MQHLAGLVMRTCITRGENSILYHVHREVMVGEMVMEERHTYGNHRAAGYICKERITVCVISLHTADFVCN
jgi:hypothetical protein